MNSRPRIYLIEAQNIIRPFITRTQFERILHGCTTWDTTDPTAGVGNTNGGSLIEYKGQFHFVRSDSYGNSGRWIIQASKYFTSVKTKC